MITFISSLYNEEAEIADLLSHVFNYVDKIYLVDDGSTDRTANLIGEVGINLQSKWDRDNNNLAHTYSPGKVSYTTIDHTGLCEVGRIEALKYVKDDSWVIMLDADERFEEGVLPKIVEWINSNPEQTHMYFNQLEFIDGQHIRTYQKVKVFKKSVAHLPEIIHGDPAFDGDPVSFEWVVLHRKTSNKQIEREIQYLQTYEKLRQEGKIDAGKQQWFIGMHHYVKSHG